MSRPWADKTEAQRERHREQNRKAYRAAHPLKPKPAATTAKPPVLNDPARRLLLAARGRARGQFRYGLTQLGTRPETMNRDRAGEEEDAAFGFRARALAANDLAPVED